MLLGRKPDAREVAALDAYLVTVCDHGMNASTFATRVVASTQADLFASVTAGYCALTGPLHGALRSRCWKCSTPSAAASASSHGSTARWRGANG